MYTPEIVEGVTLDQMEPNCWGVDNLGDYVMRHRDADDPEDVRDEVIVLSQETGLMSTCRDPENYNLSHYLPKDASILIRPGSEELWCVEPTKDKGNLLPNQREDLNPS
jgi:hypothetical protein